MEKTNDLSLTLDELRRCGEALVAIADSLREIFSTPDPEPKTEKKKKKEPEKTVTFEELRGAMAKKTRVSKENTDAIRALLQKYGAGRLSDIKPEDYAALLKEAEVIPDA